MNRIRAIYRRTYLEKDWLEHRMEYIQEARAIARERAPAEVRIYVRDNIRNAGMLMVTIKSH